MRPCLCGGTPGTTTRPGSTANAPETCGTTGERAPAALRVVAWLCRARVPAVPSGMGGVPRYRTRASWPVVGTWETAWLRHGPATLPGLY